MKKLKLFAIGLAAILSVTGTGCKHRNKNEDKTALEAGGVDIISKEIKTFEPSNWTEKQVETVLGEVGIDASGLGKEFIGSLKDILDQSTLTYEETEKITKGIGEIVNMGELTTFEEAKTKAPKAIKETLQAFVDIDEDKFGYAVAGIAQLGFGDDSKFDLVDISGFETKEDIQKVVDYFKTTNPTLSAQYAEYISYLDLDFPTKASIEDVASVENFVYAGRAMHLLTDNFNKELKDEDCIAVAALAFDGESAEKYLETYDGDEALDRAALVLEESALTPESYEKIKHSLIKVIEISETDALDADFGDDVCLEENKQTQDFFDGLDKKLTGEGMLATYAFGTYLLKEADIDTVVSLAGLAEGVELPEIKLRALARVDEEPGAMFDPAMIAQIMKIVNGAIEDLKAVGLYDKFVKFCASIGIDLPAILALLNQYVAGQVDEQALMEALMQIPENVEKALGSPEFGYSADASLGSTTYPLNYEFGLSDVSFYIYDKDDVEQTIDRSSVEFVADTSKVGACPVTIKVKTTKEVSFTFEITVKIVPDKAIVTSMYFSSSYDCPNIEEKNNILLIKTGDYSSFSEINIGINYKVGAQTFDDTINIASKIKATDTTKYGLGYFDVTYKAGQFALPYIIYNEQTDVINSEFELTNSNGFTVVQGKNYILQGNSGRFGVKYQQQIKNTDIVITKYDYNISTSADLTTRNAGVHSGTFTYMGKTIQYEYTVLLPDQCNARNLHAPSHLTFYLRDDVASTRISISCSLYYGGRYVSYYDNSYYTPTEWKGVDTSKQVSGATGSCKVIDQTIEFTYDVIVVN